MTKINNDLFDLSDLSGPDAIRLQAPLPGAHVHEHRSSDDDVIELTRRLIPDVN